MRFALRQLTYNVRAKDMFWEFESMEFLFI